jgi:hypothetical protein
MFLERMVACTHTSSVIWLPLLYNVFEKNVLVTYSLSIELNILHFCDHTSCDLTSPVCHYISTCGVFHFSKY